MATSTSDTAVEDSIFYCVRCQMKYEGTCPEHGSPDCADEPKTHSVDANDQHFTAQKQAGHLRQGRDKLTDGESKLLYDQFVLKEDIHTCVLCHLSFCKPEFLHMHKEMMHSEKYKHLLESSAFYNVFDEQKRQEFLKAGSRTMDSASSSTVEDLLSGYQRETINLYNSLSYDYRVALQKASFSNELYKVSFCHPMIDIQSCKSEENDDSYERQAEFIPHFDVKSYKCDTCGKGFNCDSRLEEHRRIHSEQKPYTCGECGLVFVNYSYYLSHKSVHTGATPYKCDVCGRGFAYSSCLYRHRKLHKGIKPYKCDICGIGFAANDTLQSHVRIHTGEKPYICDVCDKGFTQSSNLQRHKRKHTGEKPYKCDLCGAEFAYSNLLQRHTRMHTGEKPYKCEVCGVAFTCLNYLQNHKSVHSREKPFKCDVCGKLFKQLSSLNKHRKLHPEIEASSLAPMQS
ncbi:hypothetical protein BsWGS_27522 [Bradybaena similaris]